MGMQVVFYKVDNGRLCAWVATPPKRKRFQGTTMASGRDLPHDLAQFVVEATLGLQHGFWGLLANGATFKSVVGRRRTQPGPCGWECCACWRRQSVDCSTGEVPC